MPLSTLSLRIISSKLISIVLETTDKGVSDFLFLKGWLSRGIFLKHFIYNFKISERAILLFNKKINPGDISL